MDGAAEAVAGVVAAVIGAVAGPTAAGGDRGVGFFCGEELGLDAALAATSAGFPGGRASEAAAVLVSEDLRNHCTGLAHLPGVTRCHSERLAELLPSSVSSAVGVVLPSAALGDGAAGTASSVGF